MEDNSSGLGLWGVAEVATPFLADAFDDSYVAPAIALALLRRGERHLVNSVEKNPSHGDHASGGRPRSGSASCDQHAF